MKHFLPLILLALSSTAWGAIREPAFYDAGASQWKRSPELLVPYIANAPVIDGAVDLREWSDAAGLGPFKVGEKGKTDDLKRDVWMMHDGKNIYIAFRFDRPTETVHPVVPEGAGRVETAEPVDAARAMFAPAKNFEKVYDFWVYANGAFGDALATRASDLNWNTEWQHTARTTPTGWEGEMAIPFAAFGLDAAPAPDQWWGFDFIDNRTTPSPLLAHWSYRGRKWDNFENFGRIRFGSGVSIRPFKVGQISNGQYGIEFNAINATDAVQKLKVSSEILARKPSESGADKSYYESIESGVTQDAQAEFTKGTTLTKEITFSEGLYVPAEGAQILQTEIEVPPGMRRVFGVGADLPVGEYFARYRIENDKGEIVASGVTVFDHATPLELKIEPYWLYSQVVDVFADLGKAGLQGEGTLVTNVLPADGKGVPLKTATDKVADKAAQAKGSVSVDGLAPGFYQIQAILLDAAGKEIARNSAPIQRPEKPVWFKNNMGNQILVPEPWTPLKADAKGIVNVWGRTYDLSQVLPAAVTSNGQKVLQSPVQLRTETSAGPVKWAVKQLALKSQTDARATYDVALEGGGLRASGTMWIEFDGFIWYQLTVAPLAAPVEIKSMILDIPVEAKLSELMGRHKFLDDPVFYKKPPVPEEGQLPGLLRDTQLPFTPYIWIGSEKAGMGFTAEAPMDWSVSNPLALLETKPSINGSPGRILANIVQTPKTLSKSMRLEFGLQATPIREARKDRDILNIYQKAEAFDDEKEYQEIAKRGIKTVVYYYSWRGNDTTELGGTPERPVDPEVSAKLKRGIDLAHKYGMKVILYSGWGVNATSPNWKKYSYELASYPINSKGWGAYDQSAGLNGAYVDFMAWGHADIAREFKADGVLWDSAANIGADNNARIGNAWTDDEGRSRPKYAILATRELYRRVYNIYHGEVAKDGIIYNHAGSLWPVNVFADMQNRGEGRPMVAKSLRESWIPFEEFRSEYSAEPFGTLYSGEINDWGKHPMRVSTHLAVTLLHADYAKEYALMGPPRYRSYAYEARPLWAVMETFDWVPMDGTETRNYYYNNAAGKYQAVKVTPASLLSSVFTSGDKKRAVVVVSNLDQTPVPGAVVDITPAALGLETGKPLKIQDGITLENLEAKDGKLTLDIDQQRYRLLKVWVE